MGRVWSSWSPSAWPGCLDVSALLSSISRSFSRLWPSLLDLSSTAAASSSPGWWPPFDLQQLDLSVLDSVLWPVVVAVESVALVSMLCFFFLFCGCNI